MTHWKVITGLSLQEHGMGSTHRSHTRKMKKMMASPFSSSVPTRRMNTTTALHQFITGQNFVTPIWGVVQPFSLLLIVCLLLLFCLPQLGLGGDFGSGLFACIGVIVAIGVFRAILPECPHLRVWELDVCACGKGYKWQGGGKKRNWRGFSFSV